MHAPKHCLFYLFSFVLFDNVLWILMFHPQLEQKKATIKSNGSWPSCVTTLKGSLILCGGYWLTSRVHRFTRTSHLKPHIYDTQKVENLSHSTNFKLLAADLLNWFWKTLCVCAGSFKVWHHYPEFFYKRNLQSVIWWSNMFNLLRIKENVSTST